jgi:hypothetical protein
MPYRKSVVQVNFRLRQDTLSKLEREAKRCDRSVNDEIMRRLEESLTFDDWHEKREELLVVMRTKLERHLRDPAPVQEETAKKPGGKRLIQARYRLRQDILRKLEREGKKHGRSMNDEIGSRLEESFNYGDWRTQQEKLFTAMVIDLNTHPNPEATKAAFAEIDISSERDIQANIMEYVFSDKKAGY